VHVSRFVDQSSSAGICSGLDSVDVGNSQLTQPKAGLHLLATHAVFSRIAVPSIENIVFASIARSNATLSGIWNPTHHPVGIVFDKTIAVSS
jgi:hypothetical protein